MFNRMNRFTSLPMKALQGADGTFPGQALALSLARSLAQIYATLPALSISPISLLTTATATTTTNVSFVTKPQQQLPPLALAFFRQAYCPSLISGENECNK